MFEKNRIYGIAEVQSAAELAEKLTEHTWTLCTGFRLGELLFVNDSTCEDGAAEFAVFRKERKIESVTFGWMTQQQAIDTILDLAAGGGIDLGVIPLLLEDARGHRCGSCA